GQRCTLLALGDFLALAFQNLGEDVGGIHGLHTAHYCCSRKFFRSRCPCSVRIDSGWNCTPSMGKVLWRTPMISSMLPSSFSVQAVTSRQSGRLSCSITSEW